MAIDTTELEALIAVTPDPGGYWDKDILQELKDNLDELDGAALPAVGSEGEVLTVVSGAWSAAPIDALPEVGNEGEVLTTVSGEWVAAPIDALPAVGNEGEVLTVVSGAWTAAAIPTELPAIASSTDTLVLTVVSGTTTAVWSLGTPGEKGATGATGAAGGFNSVQTIKTVSANYTLTLAEAGALVKATAAAQISVPLNSAVEFDIGQHIDIVAYTSASVTVAPISAGVTLRLPYGDKIKTQYGAATLVKMATNEWLVTGDMETV